MIKGSFNRIWHIIQSHQIILEVDQLKKLRALTYHFSIHNHFFIQTDKQYVGHLYNLRDTLNLKYKKESPI